MRHVYTIIVGVLSLSVLITFVYIGKVKQTPSATSIRCKQCNVILIAIDPLRIDAVHAFGNPRPVTPTIDTLAKEGVSFTQAFTVAPWTLPSAMSLMTGVYPSTHGIINKELIPKESGGELIPANLKNVSPQLLSLATALKSVGYVTGGFAGGAAFSPTYGFDMGFDEYQSVGAFEGLSTVLPRAVDFIRKHEKEKMFVFIHGFDTHGQYIFPDGYDRRFVDASYNGALTGSTLEQKTLREEGVLNGRIYLTDKDVAFLRSVYDEKVLRMDALIGKLVNELTRRNLKEKTIIIFTSDHGDEFYEHGRIDHGMTLFDEVLHVPLIMVIPGAFGGKRVEQQVRNIDIIPTIFGLLGERPTGTFVSQLEGRDLTPTMFGRNLRLDLYAETAYRYATFQKAIRSWDGKKLIYDEESQTKRLYHIRDDPDEQRDQSGLFQKEDEALFNSLFFHIQQMSKKQ